MLEPSRELNLEKTEPKKNYPEAAAAAVHKSNNPKALSDNQKAQKASNNILDLN